MMIIKYKGLLVRGTFIKLALVFLSNDGQCTFPLCFSVNHLWNSGEGPRKSDAQIEASLKVFASSEAVPPLINETIINRL